METALQHTARFAGNSFLSLVEWEHESVQFSIERIFLMAAQLGLGVTTVVYAIFISIPFAATSTSASAHSPRPLPKSVRVAFLLVCVISLLSTTWHFVDNLFRPVAYNMPKYLYQKLVFAEMETTPLTFFFICASFSLGYSRLLLADNTEAYKGARLPLFVFWILNITSYLHWWLAPWSAFPASANASIVAETSGADLVFFFTLYLSRYFVGPASASESAEDRVPLVPLSGAGHGSSASASAHSSSTNAQLRRRSEQRV